MKGLARNMYVMFVSVFVLAMSGCKTNGEVTRNLEENAHAVISGMTEDVSHDELHERDSSMIFALHTSETDSLVERFWERTVVDSCGRVLFQDSGHTKDSYRKKETLNASREMAHHLTVGEQVKKLSQATADSSCTVASSLGKTSRPTCRWLWFVGLLVLLVATGAIISKVTR